MEELVAACSVGVVTFLVSKWRFWKHTSDPEPIENAKDVAKTENPDWEWSSYDEFEDQFGATELKKREAESSEEVEDGPFKVIYRRRKDQLWPDVVQVGISSAPLIQILREYLPNDGELKSAAEPKVDGRNLFVVLDDLKRQESARRVNAQHDHALSNGHGAHAGAQLQVANGDAALANGVLSNGNAPSQTKGVNGGQGGGGSSGGALTNGEVAAEDKAGAAAEGEQHLAHLIRFLEKEYGGCTARVRRMKDENRASWDLLWAILPADSRVVYKCENSGELLYAVVSANYYHYNEYTPVGWWFLLELNMWDYDGTTYRQCQIRRQIAKYEGERSFANLAVCPVETFGPQETMEAKFLENGRRFYDLGVKERSRFMLYTGPMFQRRNVTGCWQLFKDNADGRVMIDLASFAKMNPGYPMETAEAQSGSLYIYLEGRGRGIEFRASDQSTWGHGADSKDIEKNLIFAPAIVYGFSFSLKRWGAFAVSGFQEVSFDSVSFHELVMEADLKRLIHNLVSQYLGPADQVTALQGLKRVDPISRKGEGCIFLCYGPPGSGKTLTAESLAENMRRPLWALSVSELGTTPDDLEQTLVRVLDVASTWRAVLLLDEADVYLEKRTSAADLQRNAMTGVFLRLLEYYKGVLFLTTNRIETFDEAFRSRISVFLPYRKLGDDHKVQVWTTLLKRAGVRGVPPASIADFAAQDLNGREIRNTIHTASVWAKSNGESAAERHVKYVLDITKNSLEILGRNLAMSAG